MSPYIDKTCVLWGWDRAKKTSREHFPTVNPRVQVLPWCQAGGVQILVQPPPSWNPHHQSLSWDVRSVGIMACMLQTCHEIKAN